MARTDTLGHFLTDVADAIREKGGTSSTIQASDFDTAIENLPGGGEPIQATIKDVNFYDHTGFRHYSYTASEFANLESLPEVPTLQGLTSEGWNWTLSDAKTYVNKYGGLDIGATYITSDNSTRIYIDLENPSATSIRTRIYTSNGSVELDWGDNSATETYTDNIDTIHNYSSAGKYVIKLTPSDITKNIITLSGSTTLTYIVQPPVSEIPTNNNTYQDYYGNCIKKIELGPNVTLGSSCLTRAMEIQSINLPKSVISTATFLSGGTGGAMQRKLKCLVLPNTFTSIPANYVRQSSIEYVCIPKECTVIGNRSFQEVRELKSIWIPEGMTTTPQYFVQYAGCLTKIVIPSTVTEVYTNSFTYTGLRIIDFHNHTAIPTTSTSAFSSLRSDFKIVVPDALYEDWIADSNWSTYANNIIKYSDYIAL